MPPAPFFAPEDADRVEALLDQGLSYRQIAQQFGCDKNTVSKFVRQYVSHRHVDPAPVTPLKILVLDIETIAGIERRWSSYQKYTNPDMIVKDAELFCFAAKWLGSDDVEFHRAGNGFRSGMITHAHALLSEADGVVTFNGDRFDLPHLNLEFLRSGMAPPSPYKSIDLLKTIHRRFKFNNYRLMQVSRTLNIGEKIANEGWPLWEACESGDVDAWRRMREYNEQDVRLTEQLYYELLPWIEQHPSYAIMLREDVCPNCGRDALHAHGEYRTKTGAYDLFQCDRERGGCGKWCRSNKRHAKAAITETALS